MTNRRSLLMARVHEVITLLMVTAVEVNEFTTHSLSACFAKFGMDEAT